MTTTGKPTSDDTEDDITKTDQVEDAEIVEDSLTETPEGDAAGIDEPVESELDAEPEETEALADVEPASEEVETLNAEPGPTEEPEPVSDLEATETAALVDDADPADEPESSDKPDVVEDAAPVPTPPVAPVEVPRIKSGPGFLTMLVGGLIAGVIGYVLAYATEFKPLPGLFGQTDPAEQITGLESTLTEQSGRVSAVEEAASAANDAASAAAEQASQAAEAAAAAAAQASTMSESLAALEAQVTELTPGEEDIPPALLDTLRSAALGEVEALSERVAAAEAQVGSVEQRVSSVAEQIEALGGLAAGAATEQLSAYEQQLATLQSELDAQRDAIAVARTETEEMSAAAAAQQQAVLAEAALARVRAAVSGGGVFAGPLADLQATTDVEIPAALSDVAGSGVKSLPQLQDSFPAAARAALDASIAADADTGTPMERLGNFLRTQSGARSLSEREGDDPDAVLSRAQARLSEGDVQATLAEISALNEAGQAAMAGWVEDAKARAEAEAAVSDLSSALAAE